MSTFTCAQCGSKFNHCPEHPFLNPRHPLFGVYLAFCSSECLKLCCAWKEDKDEFSDMLLDARRNIAASTLKSHK